jgi:hypothetical protein
MLAMLVLASLVVPGVVAARQQTVDPVAAAAAVDTLPVADDDLGVLADRAESSVGPSGVACYLVTCTNRAQCQQLCDDPGATCAPSEFPPHRKYCMLQ